MTNTELDDKVGKEMVKKLNPCVGIGYVDDILEPRETRRRLCLDLETLSTKNQSNPWKKHGNMPL